MIAVTGANGLLGSYVIRELHKNNVPFVALKRKSSDVSLLHDVKDITWRDADVEDAVALDEAFKDITKVIHTAAVVSFNPKHAKKIHAINVLGTRNVVNACLENKIQRLVHISSVAALGRQKGQTHIDEKNKWTDSPLNSTYAESKYLAELEVFRGQQEGLSTITLNPSVILAAADWTKSSAQLFKYVWDERPYYIDGSLNYVDARDAAQAVYLLLNREEQGERFILNAGNCSFIDFFSKVAVALNKKAPSIKLNQTFLKIAAQAEAIRAKFHNSEPLITKETARLAGTNFLYENKKVIKNLNFTFKSIDETIQWCSGYYLSKFRQEN